MQTQNFVLVSLAVNEGDGSHLKAALSMRTVADLSQFPEHWQLMPAFRVEDERRLDARHARPAGQAVEGEILEMRRVADDDMDDDV